MTAATTLPPPVPRPVPDFDFRRLEPAAPPRHGVTVVLATTEALPVAAGAALAAWRTTQYRAAGYLDPDTVDAGAPVERAGPGDLHALAVGTDGRLLAAVSLKRLPAGGARLADERRPLFACEEVQGRTWQRALPLAQAAAVAGCREASRFVRDLSRPPTALQHRAALEVALAMGRAVTDPARGVTLVLGDLDPSVAGRSLDYLFVPTATFPARRLTLAAGQPLAPRYREHATAPFAVRVADLDRTTFLRWADLDAALDRPDPEFLARRQVLRRFVLARPSRLSPGLTPPVTARWPSLEVAAGDRLPVDRVVVVDRGELRALPVGAALGPGGAHLPPEDDPGPVAALVAVTPGRVLLPSAEEWSTWR